MSTTVSSSQLSRPNPAIQNDFVSYGGSLKVKMPLVINEHEVTGVTVFTLEDNDENKSPATVRIIASGPVVLKETGGREEKNQITTTVQVPGNSSFQIQSHRKYDYPSGKGGDCLAQANITFRRLYTIGNMEIVSDSLSIDLYIKRKFINAIKSTWTGLNIWLASLGGSIVISSLTVVVDYFFGGHLASLIPYFLVIFISFLALTSVFYSWYVRDKIIRSRLDSNYYYQQLKERKS